METEPLVETIEASETLKTAISKDNELIHLISRNIDSGEILGLLRTYGDDIKKLKGKLRDKLRKNK